MVDANEKVLEAIERTRPFIQADGGDIILMKFDEETGQVEVLLLGKFAHYSGGSMTIASKIEGMLKRDVPEVKEVRVVRRGFLTRVK